jgi:hypothetical protein
VSIILSERAKRHYHITSILKDIDNNELGCLLKIELKFKRMSLVIIGCYIPLSREDQLDKSLVLNKSVEWLKEATARDKHILFIGDLNEWIIEDKATHSILGNYLRFTSYLKDTWEYCNGQTGGETYPIENWELFKTKLDKKISTQYEKEPIENITEIDNIIYEIAMECIPKQTNNIKAERANQVILKLKTIRKNLSYAISDLPKCKNKTIKILNLINKWDPLIVPIPIIEKLKDIQRNNINKLEDTEKLGIISKKIIKKLKDRILTEAQYNLTRKIKKAIQKRQLNFKDNISTVIKSLKRGPLDTNKMLDRIILKKDNNIEIYSDPDSINTHAINHFENHFKSKGMSMNLLPKDMLQLYKQKPLKENIAEYLNSKITTEEITNAINQSPNNKATGDSGVSYELLKHLGPIALNKITQVFNYYLENSIVPPSWKLGIIIPIPKKPEVNGEIELYRPITLLEVVRKIFTGIITKRLYKIIIENNLLNGINVGFMPDK